MLEQAGGGYYACARQIPSRTHAAVDWGDGEQKQT